MTRLNLTRSRQGCQLEEKEEEKEKRTGTKLVCIYFLKEKEKKNLIKLLTIQKISWTQKNKIKSRVIPNKGVQKN